MFGPGHMATIILYAAQGEPMPVSPPPPLPRRSSPPTEPEREGRSPGCPGCGFGCGASRSVSGRVAADNVTLFTVKGKGNFKGIAHMVSMGG